MSQDDYYKWVGYDWGYRPSLYEYDTRRAAWILRGKLRINLRQGRCGIFYATAIESKAYDVSSQRFDSKVEAEEIKVLQGQLRAQVRDYIKWLKAEGVI